LQTGLFCWSFIVLPKSTLVHLPLKVAEKCAMLWALSKIPENCFILYIELQDSDFLQWPINTFSKNDTHTSRKDELCKILSIVISIASLGFSSPQQVITMAATNRNDYL
jgi:hypothetical protein